MQDDDGPWWPEADERERRFNNAKTGSVRYLSGAGRDEAPRLSSGEVDWDAVERARKERLYGAG